MLIAKYSSSAHELLLHFLSVSTKGPPAPRGLPGGEPRSTLLRKLQVVPQWRLTEPPRDPEGPDEGTAANGQLKTGERGVEVDAPARCSCLRVRNDGHAVVRTAGDHAQQLLLGGPDPTADASPHRDVRA